MVTRRITSTTYRIQDDTDYPKAVHCDLLFDYYSREETLPQMFEEYVPKDRRHDDFNERFIGTTNLEVKKPRAT